MSFCNSAGRYWKSRRWEIVQHTIKLWLANLALRAYHSLMDSKIIPAHNGKFVTKLTTPDGVVGYVASDVPMAALEGLHRKLVARLAKLEAKKESTTNELKTASRAGRSSKVSISV